MTTIEIIGIVGLIPLLILLIAVFKLPAFFKTPNSKLNYIIAKYNLKSYSADVIDNLLNEQNSTVPERDKEIIRQLLKDEYSINR